MTEATRTAAKLPRWAWLLVGGAALLLLGCVALGALAYWQRDLFNPFRILETDVTDQLPPAKVELAAAMTLPPSARNLHSHYESFQDSFIHVRFEIDAADLPALLASAHVGTALSSSTIPSDIAAPFDAPWWKPRDAKRFLAGAGQVSLPSGYPEHQSLLVDTTDPATYIVYVVAFDT